MGVRRKTFQHAVVWQKILRHRQREAHYAQRLDSLQGDAGTSLGPPSRPKKTSRDKELFWGLCNALHPLLVYRLGSVKATLLQRSWAGSSRDAFEALCACLPGTLAPGGEKADFLYRAVSGTCRDEIARQLWEGICDRFFGPAGAPVRHLADVVDRTTHGLLPAFWRWANAQQVGAGSSGGHLLPLTPNKAAEADATLMLLPPVPALKRRAHNSSRFTDSDLIQIYIC